MRQPSTVFVTKDVKRRTIAFYQKHDRHRVWTRPMTECYLGRECNVLEVSTLNNGKLYFKVQNPVKTYRYCHIPVEAFKPHLTRTTLTIKPL